MQHDVPVTRTVQLHYVDELTQNTGILVPAKTWGNAACQSLCHSCIMAGRAVHLACDSVANSSILLKIQSDNFSVP